MKNKEEKTRIAINRILESLTQRINKKDIILENVHYSIEHELATIVENNISKRLPTGIIHLQLSIKTRNKT